MNLGGNGWEIIEEESYERSIALLGGHEVVDEVLEIIFYGLHRDPRGFSQVPENPGIRQAKTTLQFVHMEIIPSYRVLFRLDEGARRVHMLWMEIAAPEEMGFLGDEDDFPF